MTEDYRDERGSSTEPDSETDSEPDTGRGNETRGRDERTADPADRHAQDRTTDTSTDSTDDVDDVDLEVIDLQLLLEQIAASAGDPPEHGLAGVAARRRRRKRHRRGAVATAMTLAVAAILAAPFVVHDDPDDVTAAHAGSAGGQHRTEMPDTMQLTCAPAGIDVPVASIRPQSDGLHIEVVNELPTSTKVWVRAFDEDDPGKPVWDSGLLYVERGRKPLVQPVPPGTLRVGCRIGADDQERRVELVDVDHDYEAPELGCDEDERTSLADVAVPANEAGEQPVSFVVATQATLRSLTQWDRGDVRVTQPRGYPHQGYGTWSYQPMTEVVQDGEPVALVYLTGDDEEAPASAPWTQAPHVDVCQSFLNPDGLLRASSA